MDESNADLQSTPCPLAAWDFAEGRYPDRQQWEPLTLSEHGTRLIPGEGLRLHLSGYAWAGRKSGRPLGPKTLVAYLRLHDVDGRPGGSALTIQKRGESSVEYFDGLVYADRNEREWSAGSEHGRRTEERGSAPHGPDVERRSNDGAPLTQVAVSYERAGDACVVTMFRDGAPVGRYESPSPLPSYDAGVDVVFGARHLEIGSTGSSGYLDATLLLAEIYDGALDAESIRAKWIEMQQREARRVAAHEARASDPVDDAVTRTLWIFSGLGGRPELGEDELDHTTLMEVMGDVLGARDIDPKTVKFIVETVEPPALLERLLDQWPGRRAVYSFGRKPAFSPPGRDLDVFLRWAAEQTPTSSSRELVLLGDVIAAIEDEATYAASQLVQDPDRPGTPTVVIITKDGDNESDMQNQYRLQSGTYFYISSHTRPRSIPESFSDPWTDSSPIQSSRVTIDGVSYSTRSTDGTRTELREDTA